MLPAGTTHKGGSCSCRGGTCPARASAPAPAVQLSKQGCAGADAARAAYKAGCARCMGNVALWRARARLEEHAGALGKARALLEQARLKNHASDELWLAAIRTEQRAGNAKAAESLMAKAQQVCGLCAQRNLAPRNVIPSALNGTCQQHM